MEVTAFIMNTKKVSTQGEEECMSATFHFPLNKEEIMEKLHFDEKLNGWYCDVSGTILGELPVDMELEDLNRIYRKLDKLEGRVHEADIGRVRDKWFHDIAEMCDNAADIEWLHGMSLEELAKKEVEKYAGTVPQWLINSINLSQCVLELFVNDECLITEHGIYKFYAPPY